MHARTKTAHHNSAIACIGIRMELGQPRRRAAHAYGGPDGLPVPGARVLRASPYGVQPFDPVTLVGVCAVVAWLY